jgi:peptidoglycan/xylan/chitin deacetylase (PgdA/CDA1 family)
MQTIKKLSASRYMLLCLFMLLLILVCVPASVALVRPVRRPVTLVTKKSIASFVVRKLSLSSQSEVQDQAVRSVAQWYMQALLAQRYSDMWLVLHPHIRQKWPNEALFAAFWHTRFQDYTLHSFTLGNVSNWPDWTDPDTMQRYTHLMGLSVSLQLTFKHPPRSGSQLPPEDLHPASLLRNLPFILQYQAGSGAYLGKWQVLVGGPADLETPILPPVVPVHRTVHVPILIYHHVLPDYSLQPLSDYTHTWVVNTQDFRAQMDYLSTHGYHVITLTRMFDALYYGGPLPAKPIVLTFDDGDEEHYRLVYPILLQHHFTAMFYIISGQVGWSMRMSWPHIREMLAHGMQIGSHTVNHVDLATLLNVSQPAAWQELEQSRQTLQQQLGVVIQQFCYPYGDPFNRGTWYERQIVVAMLAAIGYVGATTAFGETGIAQDSTQPLALLRIPVYGTEFFSDFVSSLPWG